MDIRKESDIAIIGLAMRLPNEVRSPEQLWSKLINGEDLFTREENKGDFRNVYAKLERVGDFAAQYFGISKIEADLMDPQQRVLLELSKECIDNAGIQPGDDNKIGVITSTSVSSYFINMMCEEKDLFSKYSDQILNGNHPDNTPTRIAYRLGLNGPAMHIGTGCSSSLVGITQAVQQLLSYQADMMLVGGASIRLPEDKGYFYKAGGINSEDGFCRPYSDDASGTVPGEGAGVLLLKRLEDAIEDGDHIYSVISGVGANNDGRRKAGFYSPSIEGQKEVILDVYETFEINPQWIQYVEGHGTGTLVGDPIELTALSEALFESSQTNGMAKEPTYIGSIKSNIGHTDSAAGIFGVIKVALATYYGAIPPTINFTKPNSRFDWGASALTVNTNVVEWDNSRPYACVTSLGVGGTNAHVALRAPLADEKGLVVETNKQEYDSVVIPMSTSVANGLRFQLNDLKERITLSQFSSTVMNNYAQVYCNKVEHQSYKGYVYASSKNQTCMVKDHTALQGTSPVFVLSGQGRVPNITDLYNQNTVYSKYVDNCLSYVQMFNQESCDQVRGLLFTERASLNTHIDQLAIFTAEYSYGKTLLDLGVNPCALVGHSLGEIVAAALAEVFSIQDAIRLVYFRGKVMNELAPEGEMVAVRCSEKVIFEILDGLEVSLAASNSAVDYVISGSKSAVFKAKERMDRRTIQYRQLATNRAFHSSDMDVAAKAFRNHVCDISFNTPIRPVYSCVTGELHNSETARSVEYWVGHIIKPVLFWKSISRIIEKSNTTFFELGCSVLSSHIIKTHHQVHLLKSSQDGKLTKIAYTDILMGLWAMDCMALPVFNAYTTEKRMSGLCYEILELGYYWHAKSVKETECEKIENQEKQQVSAKCSSAVRADTSNKSDEEKLLEVFNNYTVELVTDNAQSFFDLGGDSLNLIALISEINTLFNSKISVKQFMKSPSVEGVKNCLDTTAAPNVNDEQIVAKTLDDIDVFSQNWKTFTCKSDESTKAQAVSFITGATGFLGVHILYDLLLRGDDVYALVRRGDKNRLIKVLKQYDLWQEAFANKIKVIAGDIEQERFSLSESMFNELSSKVDHVFHVAARVNHAYPLSELYGVNTYSIKSAVQLALSNKISTLSYVSTTDVYTRTGQSENRLEALPEVNNGYGISKSLAEHYLYPLIEKGYPIRIFRPGNIGGSTEKGISNNKDALWNWVKAVILTQKYPASFSKEGLPLFYLAPVDHISRFIVDLEDFPAGGQPYFNLIPDQPLDSKMLLEALRLSGEETLNEVGDDTWFKEAAKHRNQGIWVVDNMSLSTEKEDVTFTYLNNDRHKKHVPVTGQIESVDAQLFSKYINKFKELGHL